MSFYKANEIIAIRVNDNGVHRNTYGWESGWRCTEYSDYLLHKTGNCWTVTDIPTGFKVEGGFKSRSEAFNAIPSLQDKLNKFFADKPDHYKKLVMKKREFVLYGDAYGKV